VLCVRLLMLALLCEWLYVSAVIFVFSSSSCYVTARSWPMAAKDSRVNSRAFVFVSIRSSSGGMNTVPNCVGRRLQIGQVTRRLRTSGHLRAEVMRSLPQCDVGVVHSTGGVSGGCPDRLACKPVCQGGNRGAMLDVCRQASARAK
jgi:hypothetical protein